jgi:hypothetical protein
LRLSINRSYGFVLRVRAGFVLTIDCRVGVHGNAKVVGSIPTDATFI